MLLGCPRAADACAVPASPVVAPPLGSRFGWIVENPPAIGIRTDLDTLKVLVCQHLSKRGRNSRLHPIPITPHRHRLGAKPILVLYQPLPNRYVQYAVQSRDFSSAERVSRGSFFRGTPQQAAQPHQLTARDAFRGKGIKLPMLEERGQPSRVRKPIGELPEAVPFLAVDQVHPGCDLAKPVRLENVLRRFHRNVLNLLDSLQSSDYTPVMSIARIDHYANGSLMRRFAAPSAATW